MCGIAGYLFLNGEHQPDRLESALRRIAHRGPDDSGTGFYDWDGWRVGLGSRRLAIRDLSPAGHMPMVAPNNEAAIAFNGEIYDVDIHRRALEAEGVRFRSTSDTEVLLHGLMRYGPAFLDRVDGMYAFAFWDTRSHGLLFGRDRFGEKPLFIQEDGKGGLLFASELPALLQLSGKTPEVDPDALRHFIAWGYPDASRAILSGIRKLPAGGWEWHAGKSGSGRLAPLETNDAIRGVRSLADAGKLVHDALRDSIKDRLIADVPVGVFLSGGLDSAGVTAIADSLLPKGERLNTYTVGYPSSPVSELDAARKMAQQFRTLHHEIHLTDQFLTALPFVAGALGEPIGDPAALPTYFLSAAARKTATVLLSGEGSDEMFYGYPRYLLHDMADYRTGRSNSAGLVVAAGAAFIGKVKAANADPARRDWDWKGLGPGGDRLMSAGMDGRLAGGTVNGDPAAPWARRDDIARWLPESVLGRVDRMTMAASIEARAPYLGREIARLGFHLPQDYLRRFPYGKVALRVALKPYLTPWKRWGAKRPFAVPLIRWMQGPLKEIFDGVFFGDRLASRGWFSAEALRSIGTAVANNDTRQARLAWAILILELWARVHIDGETAAPSPEAEWKVLEWSANSKTAAA